MEFKASLNNTIIIVTSIVCAMPVTGLVIMFALQPWYGGLVLFASGLLLIVPTYMYSNGAYILTDDKLIIKRRYTRFNLEFLLKDIESIRMAEKSDFKWTIRTFGNGGLFGFYGEFYNKQLGGFKMYITQTRNRMIIKLKHPHQIIVISPDDASMLDEIKKKVLSS